MGLLGGRHSAKSADLKQSHQKKGPDSGCPAKDDPRAESSGSPELEVAEAPPGAPHPAAQKRRPTTRSGASFLPTSSNAPTPAGSRGFVPAPSTGAHPANPATPPSPHDDPADQSSVYAGQAPTTPARPTTQAEHPPHHAADAAPLTAPAAANQRPNSTAPAAAHDAPTGDTPAHAPQHRSPPDRSTSTPHTTPLAAPGAILVRKRHRSAQHR